MNPHVLHECNQALELNCLSPLFDLMGCFPPLPSFQHLATFIMDKSEAIVTVEDAVRKLKQLNSKEKIWAQEMLLQVNDKSIRLLDCGTQVSSNNLFWRVMGRQNAKCTLECLRFT